MQATPIRSRTGISNSLTQYLLPILGILAVSALAGVTEYTLSSRQTPIYQASAKLMADASSTMPNGLTTGIIFNSPNLDSVAYREAALSQAVVEQTLSRLGLKVGEPSIAQFRAKASVSVNTGARAISDIYTLRYLDSNPLQASKRVNAWAMAFLQWDDEFVQGKIKLYIKDLEAQYKSVSAAEKQLAASQGTEDELNYMRQVRGNVFKDIQLFKGLEASAQGSLRMMDRAIPPSTPTAPKPRRNATIAAFVAFLVLSILWLLYQTWIKNPLQPPLTEAVYEKPSAV
jgi:capsular polysaccharide biosynthesis protein